MIRTLIVDDEIHARQELQALLEETGRFELLGSCANAVEAIKAINRLHPEVLFLDVQMPQIDGFELLGMLDPEDLPHVVFVTAYDEYALKAFEEKALDYLLKPVVPERLETTVEKLEAALSAGEAPAYPVPPLEHIPCVSGNRIRLIDPAAVEQVRSDLSGVHLVTPQGEFFTEMTLKALEARTALVRCHKQYLVNIRQVEEIVLLENGAAEIRSRSGRQLPVSRRYLRHLKDTLGL